MKCEDVWKTVESLAHEFYNRNESWRYGQLLFNAACMLCPDVVNQIRATKYDCFYDDDKCEVFKERFFELYEN